MTLLYTTSRGKYQPFYISENEVEFSREFKDRYSLYRGYDFRARGRRLFRMPGRIDDHVRCDDNPRTFPVSIRSR